ncbi:hypothetical protein [Roseibium sp.]|uniref:hypothetical protein n=1 Tax=Roseibium sp. TaxID=1936156 RepID=UPI003265A313
MVDIAQLEKVYRDYLLGKGLQAFLKDEPASLPASMRLAPDMTSGLAPDLALDPAQDLAQAGAVSETVSLNNVPVHTAETLYPAEPIAAARKNASVKAWPPAIGLTPPDPAPGTDDIEAVLATAVSDFLKSVNKMGDGGFGAPRPADLVPGPRPASGVGAGEATGPDGGLSRDLLRQLAFGSKDHGAAGGHDPLGQEPGAGWTGRQDAGKTLWGENPLETFGPFTRFGTTGQSGPSSLTRRSENPQQSNGSADPDHALEIEVESGITRHHHEDLPSLLLKALDSIDKQSEMLSLVVLNAAMIPGWPEQKAYFPLTSKEAKDLLRSVQEKGDVNIDDIMTYLANLGINSPLREKLMKSAPKGREKSNLLLWLLALHNIVESVVSGLAREAEDALSLGNGGSPEDGGDRRVSPEEAPGSRPSARKSSKKTRNRIFLT